MDAALLLDLYRQMCLCRRFEEAEVHRTRALALKPQLAGAPRL